MFYSVIYIYICCVILSLYFLWFVDDDIQLHRSTSGRWAAAQLKRRATQPEMQPAGGEFQKHVGTF